MFQSSPSPKAGCNNPPDFYIMLKSIEVSILTQPEGRMQRRATPRSARSRLFQSSPSPKAGCNEGLAPLALGAADVSIHAQPEGRMQREFRRRMSMGQWFQSSPSPKAGCNCQVLARSVTSNGFQSSPSPKAGCNPAQGPSQYLNCCFNPHPARRPDATAGSPPRPHQIYVSILTQPEGRMQRACPAT